MVKLKVLISITQFQGLDACMPFIVVIQLFLFSYIEQTCTVNQYSPEMPEPQHCKPVLLLCPLLSIGFKERSILDKQYAHQTMSKSNDLSSQSNESLNHHYMQSCYLLCLIKLKKLLICTTQCTISRLMEGKIAEQQDRIFTFHCVAMPSIWYMTCMHFCGCLQTL